MAEVQIEIPQTLAELADLVRALRQAQRRVIWAPDKTTRRQRTETAMHLGRRMDLRLDLMSAYDRQKDRPISLPSMKGGSR